MKEIAMFFYRINTKLEKSRFLSAIKQGFIILMPIFMIGALSTLLQYFPVLTIRNFFETGLNGSINRIISLIYNSTCGFVAVYLTLSITFCYSSKYIDAKNEKIFYVINSTVCYFALLGPNILNGSLDIIEYTNLNNVFPAMIVAFCATRLYYSFSKLIEKIIHKKSKALFNYSIYSIISIGCCLLVFSLIATSISYTNVNNFNELIIAIISKPFKYLGNTFIGGFLIILVQSILWCFGIHGSNVFNSLNSTVFLFNGHDIVSKQLFDTFVLMGGCGSLICLLIALLIFSKNKQRKKIAKMSATPMLFNVNEIMVFGIPIVLNPIYFIPFIITPLIMLMTSYLFIKLGIVPPIVNSDVQWTTPIILSGIQATNSWKGAMLQAFNLVIGVLIYFPFVKLDDYVFKITIEKSINEMSDYTKKCETNLEEFSFLSQDNSFRYIAEDVFNELENHLDSKESILKYQPQIIDEKICFLEGLLRFNYQGLKYIYPPLLISIAEEKKFYEILTKRIVKEALEDLKAFQKYKNVKVSININICLLEDEEFVNWLVNEVSASNVLDNSFGIEIMEEEIINENTVITLKYLRTKNIFIIIDNFSMRETSVIFLKENVFDYLKLDGSVVSNINYERNQKIVKSIVELEDKLNFKLIAKNVETLEQKEMLTSLGCNIYQGFLYYKAIDRIKIIALLDNNM